MKHNFKFKPKTVVVHKSNTSNGFYIVRRVIDVDTNEGFYLVAREESLDWETKATVEMFYEEKE